MLHQFFLDWNTAIQSRTVVKETKNPKGIITFQQTKFRFRDHDIIMYSNIVSNTEHLPADRRRWMSELFVPSTNKVIPGTPFPTRTKCAVAILTALTEGRDHEDKVEARNQARRKREIKNKIQDRVSKLSSTSFTDEEKKLIVEYLYAREETAVYADLVINALVKYHNYITGRGLIECGINLGREAAQHINRMYGTVAMLIGESIVNKYNVQTLKHTTMTRLFLAPKDNLTTGIYTIRSGMAKMYDICKSPAKFMHLLNLLGEYYAKLTGVALNDKIESEKARLQKIREHRMTDSPNHKKGTPRNNVRIFSTNAAPVGSTIGDVFGDVLDKVNTTPAQEEAPKTKKQPKTSKKSKVKNAVTDGQINGKINETPKGEPAAEDKPEEPVDVKDDTPATEEAPEVSNETSVAEEVPEAPAEEKADDVKETGNPVLPPDFKMPEEQKAEEKPAEAPKAKRTRKTTKKTADKAE